MLVSDSTHMPPAGTNRPSATAPSDPRPHLGPVVAHPCPLLGLRHGEDEVRLVLQEGRGAGGRGRAGALAGRTCRPLQHPGRVLRFAVVGQQAEPVFELGEVGRLTGHVVEHRQGDAPQVGAVRACATVAAVKAAACSGGRGRGRADLLEPDGPMRFVGPRLAQLDEPGGVVLGRDGGTAVALGGAVEDPGVHGRDGAGRRGLGRCERLVVLVPGGVVLGVQVQPPGCALLAGGERMRVSQRSISSSVARSGSGCGPTENWLTSLPRVIPRKLGRSRAAARVRR
ncbi:hypothetical protein STENM36S_03292 [Streptomyces tendae]